MRYEDLKTRFAQGANQKLAQQMAAYMRNQFEFYGYQSAARRRLYHQDLLVERRNGRIDWQLLDQSWADPHREMQYFVCDYLWQMEKFLTLADLPRIEPYLRTKQWWDTIDSLIKPLGKLGLREPAVDVVMLRWSLDHDQWMRRVAIEHQLLRKEQMNINLLAEIIENNLDRKEFFINKAIGWALRDYSKTNPRWVRQFIQTHQEGLSALSIREANKHL